MTRDEAVQRINEGIGFRPSGNPLEPTIISRLKEAQRDLEKGKTLPRFLLVEDQVISLLVGTHTVALPTGFLRESDETRIRFFPANSTLPRFLDRRYYIDAVQANLHGTDSTTIDEPVSPSVYVVRQTALDFITTADKNYTLFWDYFKADSVLDSNIENLWLRFASDWLIGTAGLRLARSLRNPDAVGEFQALQQEGRAAVFGEDIAGELASGPIHMGGNQ